MEVTVTDDGRLQLKIDSLVYPPIPIEAVAALAAEVPAAQAAAGAAALTSVMRELTVMLVTEPGLTASINFANNAATISVDSPTFAAIQSKWNLTPNPSGALVMGPVTITEA